MPKFQGKIYVEVLCPICGRMMGKYIPNKGTTHKKGKKLLYAWRGPGVSINYLDYLERVWDENKEHWAMVRDASGGWIYDPKKGEKRPSGFHKLGFYTKPEDDPVLFEKLKKQILRGIAWWLRKGWLTKKDITDLISSTP